MSLINIHGIFWMTAVVCTFGIVLCDKKGKDVIWDEKDAFDLKLIGRLRKNRLHDSEKELFIDQHNILRIQEHSSDMAHLVWDDQLGKMAQALADTCVYKHTNLQTTNGDLTGQNIGVVRGGNNLTKKITKIIKLWYKEKEHVNKHEGEYFECRAHKTCGHYIQIVNSVTKRIGCAYNICDKIFWKVYRLKEPKLTSNKRVFYEVCVYSQPGEYNMHHPYMKGKPCGNCSEDAAKGYTCVNGLCAPCPEGSSDCILPPCKQSIVPKTKENITKYCKHFIRDKDDCKTSIYYRDMCLERCKDLWKDNNNNNFKDLFPYVIDITRCSNASLIMTS